MLNKLITLIIIILFIGCKETTYKYQKGQIVYLKPDSVKAIILYANTKDTYVVAYYDSLKRRDYTFVYEYEIYDTLNKK